MTTSADSMVTCFIPEAGNCKTRDEVLEVLNRQTPPGASITGVAELREEIPEIAVILGTFTEQDVDRLTAAVDLHLGNAIQNGADVSTAKEVVMTEVLKAVVEVACDLLSVAPQDRNLLRLPLDALQPKPLKVPTLRNFRSDARSTNINFPALWRTVVTTLFKIAHSPEEVRKAQSSEDFKGAHSSDDLKDPQLSKEPGWAALENLSIVEMFSAKYRREAREGQIADTERFKSSAALPDSHLTEECHHGLQLSSLPDARQRTVQQVSEVPEKPLEIKTEPNSATAPSADPLSAMWRTFSDSFPPTSLFRQNLADFVFAMQQQEFCNVSSGADLEEALSNVSAPSEFAQNPLIAEFIKTEPEVGILLLQMSKADRVKLCQQVQAQEVAARNPGRPEHEVKHLAQGAVLHGIAHSMAARWEDVEGGLIDRICQLAFQGNNFVSASAPIPIDDEPVMCSVKSIFHAFVALYAVHPERDLHMEPQELARFPENF
ncbi:MAG: hypothetical protein EOO24_03555 [Comamonadaceae bacterium]|nr:MAG: hypothetical protein EOO24_03555 [Comamonadaceae bacterium]